MANSRDVAIMRILIIGPLTDGSGNYSTAHRLRSYFDDNRNVCYAKDVSNFTSVLQFRDFISSNHIQCVLAIHAFKCAAVLKDCPVPYAVIFGGTDLNEDSKSGGHTEIISSIATSARCLIAFSVIMAEKVIQTLPRCDPKRIKIIPQAVKTYPVNYNWRREYQIPVNCKVFTLVAGIRPVKDPLYLVHCFSDWWLQKGHLIAYLVIIGPELQKDYFERFHKTVQSLKGVVYIGQLSIPETHQVIRDSFALVNSSVSEGMSTAILEAMELNVPVIARNISGNASIISHKCTGLLYNNPMVESSDDEKVSMVLWDTAGQENYDLLRPISYPATDVFVVCFAVDSPDSFYNVTTKWIPELRHFSSTVPVVLVATKTDLRTDRETVERLAKCHQGPISREEGLALARTIGANCVYVECSAKCRDGVDDVFQSAAIASIQSRRLASKPIQRQCIIL